MKFSTTAAIAVGVVVSSSPQQQPVFRTARTGVILDVGVLKNRRPVSGLLAKDFVVLDSGVPQQILNVTHASVPMDISLLVDTSYSMNSGLSDFNSGSRHRPAGDWIRAGVTSVAAALTSQDRLQLMPFATTVREATTQTRSVGTADLSGRVGFAARTALFDAMLAAVMQPSVAGRRHVVIVLTDGTDTASAVPEKVRNLVLDRSQATIYLVACGDRDHRIHAKETRVKIPWNFPFGGYDWILKDAAERTGGSFYTSESEGDFGQSLADALAELRSRYLISFQPQGVSESGWHSLQVQLPSHSGVEIRARKGYYAR